MANIAIVVGMANGVHCSCEKTLGRGRMSRSLENQDRKERCQHEMIALQFVV